MKPGRSNNSGHLASIFMAIAAAVFFGQEQTWVAQLRITQVGWAFLFFSSIFSFFTLSHGISVLPITETAAIEADTKNTLVKAVL